MGNSSFLLLNGYSIFGLCLTFWTNEFLGSYSNYKFIISFSMFNRMGLWRTLCLQSNFEEVLCVSFGITFSMFGLNFIFWCLIYYYYSITILFFFFQIILK